MAGEPRHLHLVPDPPAPVPARPLLGAVEVLPGQVQAALVDRSGELLRRTTTGFDPAAPDAAGVDAAVRQAALECFDGCELIGVGVAATGIVDPERGSFIEVNDVPALAGYPVADVLRQALGVPVHIEHRARLQVLGDRWFGPGRGLTSFASVSTGEVLGVGILYDGELLAPHGGRSGAHMTVVAGGEPCTCGARGCWKTVATTRWLRQRAQTAGLGADVTLAGLVRRGDEARKVVEEYADNLALGLVNIQQLFASALFVLHGEAVEGAEAFRARVEERLRRDSGWSTAAPPRVVLGEAGPDDVALLGGAGLVLTHR
ncbi:ROK family protein [Streptomyces sp. A7024]|uniref:ROK family protein n=1 Tax=Streptomyces coryli TaxID=1128680 RepID=A0A6G4UBL7_9ACTN|nr:ROK family protein [Streptomyces coryli]NGN69076.1 ROK family protein [Streptomyces coryli]